MEDASFSKPTKDEKTLLKHKRWKNFSW